MNKFSNFNSNKSKGGQIQGVKQQFNKNPFSKVDPDDFEPRRMGLIYTPPTIILEYMIPSSGKLYHHKLKLLKLQFNSNNDEFIEYLRKRHANYLFEITDEQLHNLINRLKEKLKMQQNHQNQKSKDQQPQFSKIGSTSKTTQENNFISSSSNNNNVKQKLAPLAPLNVNNQNINNNNGNKLKPLQQQKKNDWGDEDEQDDYNNHNNNWGASKTSNNFYPQNDVKNKLTEKQSNNNQKFYKSSEGFYDGDKDYHTYDLNKLDNDELKKEKQKMDSVFSKNQKRPGDQGFVYDVQEDFEPYEENEWDEDIEEDIV